jgi:hypothetical protein
VDERQVSDDAPSLMSPETQLEEAEEAGLIEVADEDEEMHAVDIRGAQEWTAPEHSLLPGIRMFTAMLDEARGGYIIDRLAECEAGLQVEFNLLEREGIVQVASAAIDPQGIPDVELAVNLALEARQEIEAFGPPGEQVEREHPAGTEEPPPSEESRELMREEARAGDVETGRELEEIEDGEEEDPDAPGEDEIPEPMGA